MKKLQAALAQAKQKGLQKDSWAWLLEIELASDTSGVVMLRLCNQPEQLRFRDLDWDGAPFKVGAVTHDQDGSVSPLQISVSNVTHEAGRFVAAAGGLGNAPARLMMVLRSSLSAGHAAFEQSFRIHEPTVTDEAVVLTSSDPLVLGEQWPIYTFSRDRCGAKWKDPLTCGALGSGYTSCEHHMKACRIRGDDEAAEGWPRLHEQWYFGFPGIPEERR